MLNPNLVKFIIKNNLEESHVEEKTKVTKQVHFSRGLDKLYSCGKLAPVHLEARK